MRNRSVAFGGEDSVSTSTYIDATCIFTATAVAACGALGIVPDFLPTEQIGIAADLGAGGMAARHALHWLKHRKTHAPQPKPTVSIAKDGRGRVTWITLSHVWPFRAWAYALSRSGRIERKYRRIFKQHEQEKQK